MERTRTVFGFEAYLPARDNAPAPSRLPLWLFTRAESGRAKTALRQMVVSENVCKLFLVPCCTSLFFVFVRVAAVLIRSFRRHAVNS
jgi:hypothetical protein